nr:putative disease resistance protein RGA4 [Quercus suber]
MAFEEEEEEMNASFLEIGKEFLKMCVGVPLAIRTIGGLLYFKKSKIEWRSFINNELSKIPQNEDDILPTLRLSYDHLAPHLKQCFAYCSLFPKDCEINKSSLINMWMAQGFITLYDEKQCSEDVGHEYFMDLLWRSFFQEAKEDEFGNISEFKIHDLMYDIAIQVTGSESTTGYSKEKDIDEKTRHVSFGDMLHSSLEIPISLSKARRIRTFLLPCQPESFTINSNHSTCSAIVASFKFIHLLDLHGMKIKTIPSFIENLKHLTYLDLSWNGDIEMLSNSIVKLYNLQTLKLSHCIKLKELPRNINKLVNLRFLEIDSCWDLTHMPNGLGQLTHLQTLSRFVMSRGRIDSVPRSNGGLKELGRLNELRGNLSIENLKHVKDAALEYKDANLKEKHRLDRLDLNWVKEDIDEMGVSYDDRSLEALQPHINLKVLRLEWYGGSLERMMINNKTSSGNLPSITSSSSSTIVAPLSKLSHMEIENTEEALPEECLRNLISLRTLCLCKCPLPQGMRYLTALQRLTVWRSEVVISNDWVEMEWQGLRTLLSLHFFDLPKLKRCKKQIGEDWHKISHIPNLYVEEPESKLAKGNITRRIESDNHAVGISSLYSLCKLNFAFSLTILLAIYSRKAVISQVGRKASDFSLARDGFRESCLILKHVDSVTKIHFNAFNALAGWKQEALCPVEVPAAAN